MGINQGDRAAYLPRGRGDDPTQDHFVSVWDIHHSCNSSALDEKVVQCNLNEIFNSSVNMVPM